MAAATYDPNAGKDIYIIEEDISKRGEFEKHYYCSDGSFIAVSYPEAIHYYNDEEWVDVDNSLIYDSKTNKYISSNKDFNVSFSKKLNDGKLITLKKNGFELSWTLEIAGLNNLNYPLQSDDSKNAEITVENGNASSNTKNLKDDETFYLPKTVSKIQYNDSFGYDQKVDLDYTVYQNKIEEDIIITEKSDISSFILKMDTKGLTAILNDDNSVDFVDSDNNVKYTISIPYMCDAADAVLHDIKVDINQSGSNCIIIYTPNEEWLNSTDRIYPILFDPSITTNEYDAAMTDTYVQEGDTVNHSSEQKFYVGVKDGNIHRTYIKITNLPNIDSTAPITSATLTFTVPSGTTTGKTFALYPVSSSWSQTTIKYSAQPTVGTVLGTCPYTPGTVIYSFPITNNVAQFYRDYQAGVNYGYLLRYADETKTNPDWNSFFSTEYTDKTSRPFLTVVYGYTLPSCFTNGGVYTIQNEASAKYLDVSGGVDADDTNVIQYTGNGTVAQKWKLFKVDATGGYRLQSMGSSNGTNRTLDIVKSGGYVTNGGNVQIYRPIDPIAQEWLIIPVSSSTFKIVPRSNMTLALTTVGTSNGTSAGTTPTSAGNAYVGTYTGSSNQKWYFFGADGNIISYSVVANLVSDGEYYINNRETGQFLRNSGNSVYTSSGKLASLGNTIRWKITRLSDGYIIIQPTGDLTLCLAAIDASIDYTYVSLISITENINTNCKWRVVSTSNGIRIRNYNNKVLYNAYGGLEVRSDDSSNNNSWRILSVSSYKSANELSSFSVPNIELNISETKNPVINKNPSGASCANFSDFSWQRISGSSSVASVSVGGVIKGLSKGTITVRATHKVTGLTYTFTVNVLSMLIYRTRNRETLGFTDPMKITDITPITAEDLTYGQKGTGVLIYNGTAISLSDLYTNIFYYDQPTLSSRVMTVKNCFHGVLYYNQASCDIFDSMFDHFMDGTGTDYYNDDLTSIVEANSTTVNYVNGIIGLLQTYISQNSGNILDLFYNENLWVQPMQRLQHPMVNAMADAIDMGAEYLYEPYYSDAGVLELCIHSLYGNKFEIESFSLNGSSYSGTLRFTLYDHFGLDTQDLLNEHFHAQVGYLPAFRQWYIMQHWNELDTGLSPQPKPFVSIFTFVVPFSGTLS